MSVIRYAKRSISLPLELDEELARQAAAEGTTVSALLASAAARSLQIRRGLAAVDNWKHETLTRFTADEIAEVDAPLDAAGAGVVGASSADVDDQARFGPVVDPG